MIVHSSRNLGDVTCEVRVEYASPEGVTDARVEAFAMGAAGRHNAGHDVSHARTVGYTLDGRQVHPDEDEWTIANGSIVEVTLLEVTP